MFIDIDVYKYSLFIYSTEMYSGGLLVICYMFAAYMLSIFYYKCVIIDLRNNTRKDINQKTVLKVLA